MEKIKKQETKTKKKSKEKGEKNPRLHLQISKRIKHMICVHSLKQR